MTDEPVHAGQCGAKTRNGRPCRNRPVTNKRRCRMHGGAIGSGGQPGNRNAWKHGGRSADTVFMRKFATEMAREAKRLVGLV